MLPGVSRSGLLRNGIFSKENNADTSQQGIRSFFSSAKVSPSQGKLPVIIKHLVATDDNSKFY